jgi:hypothetical protein
MVDRRLLSLALAASLATGASAQVTLPPGGKPVIKAGPVGLAQTDVKLVVFGPGSAELDGKACAPAPGKSQAICTIRVAAGGTFVANAKPAAGMTLSGWSGACNTTSLRCQFKASGSVELVAVFVTPGAPAPKPDQTGIMVAIVTPGGSVGPVAFSGTPIACQRPGTAPATGQCVSTVAVGAKVALEAKPIAGAKFVGWDSGEPGCQGTGVCTFTAGKYPTLVRARFDAPTLPAVISVGYLTNGLTKVELSSAPAHGFACSDLMGGTTIYRLCQTEVPKGSALSLYGEVKGIGKAEGNAGYGNLYNLDRPVSAAEWAGQCVGNPTNGCLLKVDGSRHVEIKWQAGG